MYTWSYLQTRKGLAQPHPIKNASKKYSTNSFFKNLDTKDHSVQVRTRLKPLFFFIDHTTLNY